MISFFLFDRSVVLGSVFNMLVAGVTCLKHEGFHEEREWRVIYGPDRSPSPLMKSSLEVVGGIPQIIHKLPLDVKVSDVLADFNLARIFDRLIIGPSEFSWAIYEAFTKAGDSDGRRARLKIGCLSPVFQFALSKACAVAY